MAIEPVGGVRRDRRRFAPSGDYESIRTYTRVIRNTYSIAMERARKAATQKTPIPVPRSADKPAGQPAQKPPKRGEISKQAPKKA